MHLNLNCPSQSLTASANGTFQTEFRDKLNDLKKITYPEVKGGQ